MQGTDKGVDAARPISGRFRSGWAVATVCLAAVAVGLLIGGVQADQRGLPPPRAAATSVSHPGGRLSPAGAATTTPSVAPAARSVPVALTIPAIGVSVSLSSLGLNPNGTVDVPTDVNQPGWYDLGPTPGQQGSAVVLGHVDSYLGPAVFFLLRNLVPGGMVSVVLADGVTARFAVTSVAEYTKTAFPDQAVYGDHGSSELQLVTCGGTFDSQTGHYLSNVVVYTTLVGSSPESPASQPKSPRMPGWVLGSDPGSGALGGSPLEP